MVLMGQQDSGTPVTVTGYIKSSGQLLRLTIINPVQLHLKSLHGTYSAIFKTQLKNIISKMKISHNLC